MSEYTNGFEISINEIVRINFKDQVNSNITNVFSVTMTYEALKIFHAKMGEVIEQHDAKIAQIKKAN